MKKIIYIINAALLLLFTNWLIASIIEAFEGKDIVWSVLFYAVMVMGYSTYFKNQGLGPFYKNY